MSNVNHYAQMRKVMAEYERGLITATEFLAEMAMEVRENEYQKGEKSNGQ